MRTLTVILLTALSHPGHAQVKTYDLNDTLLGRVKSYTESEFNLSEDSVLMLSSTGNTTFDSNGNVLIRSGSIGGNRFFCHKFKYDTRDNKIEEVYFNDTSGTFSVKNIHVYDQQNQVIESTQYTDGDSTFFLSKIKYSYNKQKALVEKLLLKHDDILVEKETYLYDRSMNLTTTVAYNEQGKEIRKQHRKLPEKKRGKITPTFTEEYENYDREGNWLKKTVVRNHKPYRVFARQIEYFQ